MFVLFFFSEIAQTMSDPQLLLDILDDITAPRPMVDINRLVQRIKRNAALLRREKAVKEITMKLRNANKLVKPMTPGDIRIVLSTCGVAPTSPLGVVDATLEQLRWALGSYVSSRGSVMASILPNVRTIDAISSGVYQSFIRSQEPFPLRWALCRILLALQFQCWWLSMALTAQQVHDIVQTTNLYFQRYWEPILPQGKDPWAPSSAVKTLLFHSSVNSFTGECD